MPYGAGQRPGRLQPLAVDEDEVGPDLRILGHVTVEASCDFDLVVLSADLLDQIARRGIRLVHDRHDLQETVEGNGNRRSEG